jgi:hypothetical protein
MFREERKRAECLPMDRTVARLNIEYFQKLLATEKDETKRRTILILLAEEKTKLAAAEKAKLAAAKPNPKSEKDIA